MEKQFEELLKKTGTYGEVIQVNHPIVIIEGLPKATTRELILFESGQKGEVFTVNRGRIEARVFSHEPVRVGMKVTRTMKLISVPVGKELLGHTINPLGDLLDPSEAYVMPKEFRDLDAKPAGISAREKISKQLQTGMTLIDVMLPLGLGQRELIIGDRKTGKTALLMTTIKRQVMDGMVCIYAAIAKKKSDIKKLQEFFIGEKIMEKVIIVATTSYDSPTLIFQTPYAAMSIAEYFRDLGQNTLVVFDDLSSHAKFYRELSLLARRFPGRESYPGDIFYIHSKLLERGGNFKNPKSGEAAITCLPVMEIIEGDLAGYVSTNVMGITDGHIYLDSNIYYQGMRPAVNIPLSVTRVGRQTLGKLPREINKTLTTFLTSYNRLLNLSHFGQELTADVKKDLQIGDLIMRFFKQGYQEIVPAPIQLMIISMIMQGMVENKEMLEKLRKGMLGAYKQPDWKNWFDESLKTKDKKSFDQMVTDNKEKLLILAK
jgi:F-type H+-transporting ATPase subunit alpha